MAEVKWIKLTTNMFDDEKIKLIEKMPEGMAVLLIWIKLLTLAGKCNATGYIYLSENIPYSDEMLATIFNMPLNTVRLALKIFDQFRMIDIEENNLIRISNWDKHQNIEGLDKIREQTRNRVARHREKQNAELGLNDKKNQNLVTLHNVTGCYKVTDSNATDKELELELDIDIDKEKILNTSLEIKNFRDRYSEEQLKVITDYLDILRWTRKHGKIADSVTRNIYAEWDKFNPIVVIYALELYVNNPKHHDKKENYCYGIMRNTTMEEIHSKKQINAKQLPVSQSSKIKTKFHLAKSRGDKYNANELEELILNNQRNRINKTN